MRQRPITDATEPELHFLVHHFAEQVNARVPAAVLLDDEDPLIYSTGSPARLMISEGSLHQLSNEEFERRIVAELLVMSRQGASWAIQ